MQEKREGVRSRSVTAAPESPAASTRASPGRIRPPAPSHRENDPGQEQQRRDAKRERDLAEARPVRGARDDAVDRQRQQTSDHARRPAQSPPTRRESSRARCAGGKPSVSSTAISGVRELTAAYIVFTAPNTAPTAMIAGDHDREKAEDVAEQLAIGSRRTPTRGARRPECAGRRGRRASRRRTPPGSLSRKATSWKLCRERRSETARSLPRSPTRSSSLRR